MTHWTEQKLMKLDRRQLIEAAGAMGITCYGMADTNIIYEILIRQGEMLGRAVTPIETRVYVLEKALEGYYTAFAEMAGAWAETTRYLILPKWVRDVGIRFRRKYNIRPLYSVRIMMAREKNRREREDRAQAKKRESWVKSLEERLRQKLSEEEQQ